MLRRFCFKVFNCLNRDSEILRQKCEESYEVRTEVILQNVYPLVTCETYFHAPIIFANKNELNVLAQLKKLLKEFQILYANTIRSLCFEMELSEQNMKMVLGDVANEIFCKGVTRYRVIGFFVFSGELIKICLSKNSSKLAVQAAYDIFSETMTKTIEPLIMTRGGWKWVIDL